MSVLLTILSDLLKACLPELLRFATEKINAPNTMEVAGNDAALDVAVADDIRVSIDNGVVPPSGFDSHAQP